MLQLMFYFEQSRFDTVLGALERLPNPMRPEYFGEGSSVSSESDRLDDRQRFSAFRARRGWHFSLFAEHIDYFIDPSKGGKVCVLCFCKFPLSDKQLHCFFHALASINVPFAWAAHAEEFEHRNHIRRGNVESWVGRNIADSLTGLYWWTMISAPLLHRHGVELSRLKAEAYSHEPFGECHLFKFYERSEDWEKHAPRLNDLCESLPGIFSSRGPERLVARATGLRDFLAKLSPWR